MSVHFLVDLDGTVYQTLDLKERAWHATTSNTRSVGIEIAHIGAYRAGAPSPLDEWYQTNAAGQVVLRIPARFGADSQRTPGFVGRPARPEKVIGTIQGDRLAQFDYTPEQYTALGKLTAALCAIFPKLKCDYPRDAAGQLVTHKLADDDRARYQGLLGQFHVQSNKVDPGPAFQWDRVIADARRSLERSQPCPNVTKGAPKLMSY